MLFTFYDVLFKVMAHIMAEAKLFVGETPSFPKSAALRWMKLTGITKQYVSITLHIYKIVSKISFIKSNKAKRSI